MTHIRFDSTNPDLALLRQAILQRLREQPNWNQLDSDPEQSYQKYLEVVPAFNANQILVWSVLEVFWQLVTEGIVAPGWSSGQSGFPWFRVTQYGRAILAQSEYVPHDPLGYIQLLNERVTPADLTVLAYLAESLNTFIRGNLIASTVMLGVAAERVFDLVSDSIQGALKSQKEKDTIANLQKRRSIKGRLDWLHHKLRAIQDGKYSGYPENAALMITTIYDMIRLQRNDLGHPREAPPQPSRGEVHANLLVFPRYYETAENVRTFLAANQV